MLLDVATAKGYMIASALRGPDDDSPAAWQWKRFVTGPLRGHVGIRESYIFVCSISIADKDLSLFVRASPGQVEEVKEWLNTRFGRHCCDHASEAYHWLADSEDQSSPFVLYYKKLLEVGFLLA